MKVSTYACFGATCTVATIAYVSWAIADGSKAMSAEASLSQSAKKELEAATAVWNSADSDYKNKVQQVSDAEQTIVDANCFISKYDAFNQTSSSYCAAASVNANQLQVLNVNYNLNIITKPYTASSYTFRDSYLSCYDVKVQKCSDPKDSSTCKTVTERECDRIYFTVLHVTNSYYGTTIVGSKTSARMECGRFSHEISVNANQFRAQSTGSVRVDKYNEIQNDYYGSEAIIERVIDNGRDILKHNVDPNQQDFQAVAAQVLRSIDSKCQSLAINLKQPDYYAAIVEAQNTRLPELRAAVVTAKASLDAATENKNAKQTVFDHADKLYADSQAVWLPIIFIPTAAAATLLCCFTRHYQEMPKEDLRYLDLDCSKSFTCCYDNSRNATTEQQPTNAESFQDAEMREPDASAEINEHNKLAMA